MTATQRAQKFLEKQPRCLGYPKCDGDLEGIGHSEVCPFNKTPPIEIAELLAMHARQERELLLDEIITEFGKRFYARSDHQYSGISILSWLKKLKFLCER